jgi:DNA-binding MarR family transcriptional regulator
MVRDRISSVKGVEGKREPGTNVLFKTWLVSRAATALVDRAVADAGLTGDEFAIYSVLRVSPMTPTELATWMASPATTISSSIRRLEARGHVTRQRNPEDGRSYRLALTADGRRTHQRAHERYLPILEQVEATLDRAEPGVRRALDRLRAAIDEVRTSGE